MEVQEMEVELAEAEVEQKELEDQASEVYARLTILDKRIEELRDGLTEGTLSLPIEDLDLEDFGIRGDVDYILAPDDKDDDTECNNTDCAYNVDSQPICSGKFISACKQRG